MTTMPTWLKVKEIEEMKDLLERHTFHPLHAHALHREGMGPVELEDRLRHAPGSVGSLEYTHNLVRGDAPSATNTPLPGYRKPALHPRGKARRAPKAWVPDADFDLRSEMETGYTIAEGVPGHAWLGNLYSIAYSGRAVHTIADFEAAVRYVARLQVRNADFSNVFSVNERGNVDLLRLLKKRPYYRVLHSWV